MAIIKNGVTRYMSINGRNSVAVRDEHGRWLKGFSGGPGRPIGSRNKLTEDFLGDVHAAWLKHGSAVLDRVAAEQPEVFLAIVARTIDVRRVELGQPGEFDRPHNSSALLISNQGPARATRRSANSFPSPRCDDVAGRRSVFSW